MKVRPPAVAGQFYEADRDRLQGQLCALLKEHHTATKAGPNVLIVPHAGYIYSGEIAALAYQQLRSAQRDYRRVVILGPAHRVALRGMALPTAEAFRTPLGDMSLDRGEIDRVADLPGFCISDEAHEWEHSLEVQLPFLQMLLPHATLVPVVVGHCDAATVASGIDALWGGPETLLLISTDLSHFHSYDDADKLDRQTCQRLLTRCSDLNGQNACGCYALNGLMRSESASGLQMKLLGLCNSGDTGADKQRVVGYAAFALY
jgi:AmmeMemoRadiSam system protein B